ncbi:MAG: NosD domain-containing protein [Natrialbaceae archaeon]|nr:NosD domain-containing protein [Natrialbaceae archaeon]
MNHIVDNDVTDNGEVGILVGSAGDILENNRIERNQFGIHVVTDYGLSVEGGNVTMRDNALIDNDQGLYVDSVTNADYLVALDNDIDRSNSIDGKPIVYHYNDSNIVVNGTDDPGYVGLVTVDTASVTGLNMTTAGQGVFIQNSSNVSITDGHIANTYNPVHIGLQSTAVSVHNLTAQRDSAAVTYDPPTLANLRGTGIAIERTEGVDLHNVSVSGSVKGLLLNRDLNTTITDSQFTTSSDVGIGFTYGGEGLHFSNNLLNNSVQTNYPFSGFGYTLEVNDSRQPGPNIIGGPRSAATPTSNPMERASARRVLMRTPTASVTARTGWAAPVPLITSRWPSGPPVSRPSQLIRHHWTSATSPWARQQTRPSRSPTRAMQPSSCNHPPSRVRIRAPSTSCRRAPRVSRRTTRVRSRSASSHSRRDSEPPRSISPRTIRQMARSPSVSPGTAPRRPVTERSPEPCETPLEQPSPVQPSQFRTAGSRTQC